MIISKQYVDSAIKIKKEFVDLSKKLDSILGNLKGVADKLKVENDELKDINDNLKNYDKETAEKKIIAKLIDMEKEANRLSSICEPINNRIEELRKEEERKMEKLEVL